jgi:hypothetical protein
MNEFESIIYINDIEIPVVVEYDYQPAEAETLTDPAIGEEITIISCSMKINAKTTDLFTPEYDWLLSNDMIVDLEDEILVNKNLYEETGLI